MRYGDIAVSLANDFDLTLPKETPIFEPFDLAPLIADSPFSIGLVVGASGSGKTQALKTIWEPSADVRWEADRCVADHFNSKEAAQTCLTGAGLNSIPQWMKPHALLSNGEQYRANLARLLYRSRYETAPQNRKAIIVDEFTSVVDRVVARSLCEALRRFTAGNDQIVLATCHFDVADWLKPDWIVDVMDHTVTRGERFSKPQWKSLLYAKAGVLTRG